MKKLFLSLVFLVACSDSQNPLNPTQTRSNHLSEFLPAYIVPVSPYTSGGSWYANGQAGDVVRLLTTQQINASTVGKATIQKVIDAINDVTSKTASGRLVEVNTSGGIFVDSAGKYADGYINLDISIVKWP